MSMLSSLPPFAPTGPDPERLYHLLPAIYRIRDDAAGGALRALLGVAQKELDRLKGDMDELYANCFIETCDEWVVPYIGDLLGVKGLQALGSPVTGTAGSTSVPFSQRSLVANTLSYRQGKGTAATIEQVARDVTGWPARAVEFFQLLSTTQCVRNHVRLQNVVTPDLRNANALDLLDGPFETATHTADVRHINVERGKYNIPNVGVYLWRLEAYPISGVTSRAVVSPSDGRYTFDPQGRSAPLFNQPQALTDYTRLTVEANAPGILRRRVLFDELNARRSAMVAGDEVQSTYFGDNPVLEVSVRMNGQPWETLAPEQLVICNLSDFPNSSPVVWRRPEPVSYTRADGSTFATRVSVDPVLGRLALAPGDLPDEVKVSFTFGFSGDMGGGPYDRTAWLQADLPAETVVNFQMGVTRDAEAGDPQVVATLAAAIDAWNALPPGRFGLIVLMDSQTYSEDLTGLHRIQIPAESRLMIVAAQWPLPADTATGGRPIGQVEPTLVRPLVDGAIEVQGLAPQGSTKPGQLIINGLWISGGIKVLPGNLAGLKLVHCTLTPPAGILVTEGGNAALDNEELSITLQRCICGPIEVDAATPSLSISDSIIDSGGTGPAINATSTPTSIVTSTVFGASILESLKASDAIFTGLVRVLRRQVGCVRFSYLPPGSIAPRQFKCQPADLTAPVDPRFTSESYGQPGYAQLDALGPAEINAGGDDGGEMGAFHFLLQQTRLSGLQSALSEYVPFRLEAGVFFVT